MDALAWCTARVPTTPTEYGRGVSLFLHHVLVHAPHQRARRWRWRRVSPGPAPSNDAQRHDRASLSTRVPGVVYVF